MSEKLSSETGESWGETKKRIILEKVNESGRAGLPVADVLSILQKYMYDQERMNQGDPEKADGAIHPDDVSFTLLELQREGSIEIKEGAIYPTEKK